MGDELPVMSYEARLIFDLVVALSPPRARNRPSHVAPRSVQRLSQPEDAEDATVGPAHLAG
jgi:hypothetical protein